MTEEGGGRPGEDVDPATANWRSLADELRETGRLSAAIRDLGLPAVLTCGPPHERETEYIQAPAATWAHLSAAEGECLRKGREGPQTLAAIRATMRRLRPYMESDPECTVETALRREGKGG